ncbi:MAG: Rieske 2Fe-2S domain-containing protein [Pseudomonadota bacterium]
MSILKRIFGICVTRLPADGSCWKMSDGKIVVDLEKAPELGRPGGAIRIEQSGMDNRILLFLGDDGGYHAFLNKCACSGWRIDPQPGTSTVQCCTLAKSTYSYDGKVLSGPAKEPAQVFPVTKDGNKITISIA